MSFAIREYARLRTHAYHLTDVTNTQTLRRWGEMLSSAILLDRAGLRQDIGTRRRELKTIVVDGCQLVLKDQKPLVLKNAALAAGWTERDFVAHLDNHVFFWPGGADGPIKHDARLFDSYDAKTTAVLRVRTDELFAANPSNPPLFCPFNSGAPRQQKGRPVPRGLDLFLPADRFPRTVGKVVELVFRGSAALPLTTEVRNGAGWTLLTEFDADEG